MEEVNILEIINISIAVKPMLGLNSIDNIACKLRSKMEDRAEETDTNPFCRKAPSIYTIKILIMFKYEAYHFKITKNTGNKPPWVKSGKTSNNTIRSPSDFRFWNDHIQDIK